MWVLFIILNLNKKELELYQSRRETQPNSRLLVSFPTMNDEDINFFIKFMSDTKDSILQKFFN